MTAEEEVGDAKLMDAAYFHGGAEGLAYVLACVVYPHLLRRFEQDIQQHVANAEFWCSLCGEPFQLWSKRLSARLADRVGVRFPDVWQVLRIHRRKCKADWLGALPKAAE